MIFPPLPPRRYEIIYADPPWHYKGNRQFTTGGKDSGGADSHYQNLELKDLKTLAIPKITAENSLLFMWATSPHLDQAIELGKAWGFSWATIGFVWYKEKTNPGYYTLSQCELCLVFKHGKIPEPRGARDVRQFLSEPRQRHSEKPGAIRDRIAEMFPTQLKIELFARTYAPGWSSWGDEITPDPSTAHAKRRLARQNNQSNSFDF